MDQELFIFILEIEIQLFKLTQCTFRNSNFVNTNFYNNTQSYILPFNTFSFITFNILLPWESDLYEKFLKETWKLNNTLATNLLRPCNLNNTIHIRWGDHDFNTICRFSNFFTIWTVCMLLSNHTCRLKKSYSGNRSNVNENIPFSSA